MKDLEIAFDLKGFQEYFIKYKKKEYKGELAKGKTKTYYIFEKKKLLNQPIELQPVRILNVSKSFILFIANGVPNFYIWKLLLSSFNNPFISSSI